ncbi:MAG: AMP-binding protein [Planctomycetes bacterium]|nr:AMP-binding protein [Planctomycetota bacterium]
MQLEEFLEASARNRPDQTALICGDRRWSYAEIEGQCNRLAHALLAKGVARGDRVAVYLENSFEAVAAIFAILKAGAVFLVINPTTKAEKLSYILNNCRAAALITHDQKLASVQGIFQETPHLKLLVAAGREGPAPVGNAVPTVSLEGILREFADRVEAPPKRCIDIDLAALVYTSGSTGNPKGVMLTHLNMVSAATSITTYLENTDADIILNVLPLSFDYGLYQVLMAFKFGGTVVLERSFTYPHAVVEKLIKEKVTGLPVVPTILAILLQMDLSKNDFPSLRYITNTGAALPVPFIRRLRGLFPKVKIYSMYGLTECKRVSYLPPDQIDLRPTSVGKGMPNEEIYIVDEQGRRVGPGAVGELVVRGSNVMKGYWELPQETEKMLKPDPLPGEKVLYTGDLFRMDEEGWFYFVGRKDDIIKTRGEKVSPKEVENILYGLEGVAEAAVIGIPDDILGQAVKAVVTLKPGAGLTPKDVQRYCSQHLEDFMVPKVVEIRDLLPKTSTGKIAKKELS